MYRKSAPRPDARAYEAAAEEAPATYEPPAFPSFNALVVLALAALFAISIAGLVIAVNNGKGGSPAPPSADVGVPIATTTFALVLRPILANGTQLGGYGLGDTYSVQLTCSGGDLATTITAEPFSFSLPADGFLWTFPSLGPLMPAQCTPSGLDYASGAAGSGAFAHFFRDGTLRFAGEGGVELGAGAYSIGAFSVTFRSRKPGRAAPVNFRVSAGLSDAVTPCETENFPSLCQGEYFEYFSVKFAGGNVYVVAPENWHAESSWPYTYWNGTMLMTYYAYDDFGNLLVGPTLLDPTPQPGSPANLTHGSGGQQQEPGMVVDPKNPRAVAALFCNNGRTLDLDARMSAVYSTDGGQTFEFTHITYGLAYPRFVRRNGEAIIESAGDTGVSIDPFGVVWFAGLAWQGYQAGEPYEQVYAIVGTSTDMGASYKHVDLFDGVDPRPTAGLDYIQIDSGPDGEGGAITALILHGCSPTDNGAAFCYELPTLLTIYHTSQAGVVDGVRRIQTDAPAFSGYGGVAVGPNGEIYVVGSAYPWVSADSSATYPRAAGTFGTGNTAIYLTSCLDGWRGNCSSSLVGRTNMGSYDNDAPAQPVRGTWPKVKVWTDKRGRVYIAFTDKPAADPSLDGFNVPSYSNYVQVAYSDDRGETWSSVLRVDDDPNATSKINPAVAYDPVSDQSVVAFIDSRDDPEDQVQTAVYAAVLGRGEW